MPIAFYRRGAYPTNVGIFRLATSLKEGLAKPGFYKDELIYLLQKGYEYVLDVNGAEWLIKMK